MKWANNYQNDFEIMKWVIVHFILFLYFPFFFKKKKIQKSLCEKKNKLVNCCCCCCCFYFCFLFLMIWFEVIWCLSLITWKLLNTWKKKLQLKCFPFFFWKNQNFLTSHFQQIKPFHKWNFHQSIFFNYKKIFHSFFFSSTNIGNF